MISTPGWLFTSDGQESDLWLSKLVNPGYWSIRRTDALIRDFTIPWTASLRTLNARIIPFSTSRTKYNLVLKRKKNVVWIIWAFFSIFPDLWKNLLDWARRSSLSICSWALLTAYSRVTPSKLLRYSEFPIHKKACRVAVLWFFLYEIIVKKTSCYHDILKTGISTKIVTFITLYFFENTFFR